MCQHTLARERSSKEGEKWRETEEREMGSSLSWSLLKRVMT